ncbi:MAG: hypothetical protein PHD76_08200 [Methylacidiphilales bacterium]|nr:hypothetical protein [Candidatus Methylacidiphilales bacterium]
MAASLFNLIVDAVRRVYRPSVARVRKVQMKPGRVVLGRTAHAPAIDSRDVAKALYGDAP